VAGHSRTSGSKLQELQSTQAPCPPHKCAVVLKHTMSGPGSVPPAVLKRHAEIKCAVNFFLRSWYKHKQAGTTPSPQQVLLDFARWRSLAVLDGLKTAAPHVVRRK
jgi:hypothetical protein